MSQVEEDRIMSIQDPREIEKVKIVMLKGEKGETGDVTEAQMESAISEAVDAEETLRQQADATLERLISEEADARENADAVLDSTKADKTALASEASTRESADTTELSARMIADANLQAQIDEIIAPSGEAPSVAEIENARIGADGITYNTLGNAIRGQINKTFLDYGGAGNGQFASCDNITNNSIYFVSANQGNPNIPDFPFSSGWLQTFVTNSNLKMQIAYPYNADDSIKYRNKRIAQGWTSWKAVDENTIKNYGGAGNGQFASCDNITKDSIYFVSVNQGNPNIPDFPFSSGWLQTIVTNSNLIMQIAYPYNADDSIKYRNKRTAQGWTSWKAVDENTIKNYGGAGNGQFASCDNITKDSIYFVSAYQGNPNIPDFPLSSGWLQTIVTNSNLIMQIAYPYNADDSIKYRNKRTAQDWTSWKAVAGDTVTITQEVNRDTYNNTYEITTIPTITTDSNGWLQPIDIDTSDETGKTDMTGAIMSMLNSTGYCHLASGIYYVSGNIDIPEGATLEGCGKDTIIRLLGSVTSGYICRLKEYSTIKNIRFSGGYAQGDISNGNIGGRKGIIFIGNRDGQDTGITPSTTKCCQITGCWFENLDSGIYGHNAGGGMQEGLIVSNCYITRCKAGINLDYWTEYCKFTNIVTFQCYYACINNGGNNVFIGCTFHGVIGFLIDNSSRNKVNNAHGSVVGCTFNHIDNMNHPETLGNGYGIKVIDTDNGFIFTGCQIWYGKIYVESSKGIQFSDCLIGGYPTIETIGNDTVFFNGCIFHTSPTKDTASPVIYDNCYLFDGTTVQ